MEKTRGERLVPPAREGRRGVTEARGPHIVSDPIKVTHYRDDIMRKRQPLTRVNAVMFRVCVERIVEVGGEIE